MIPQHQRGPESGWRARERATRAPKGLREGDVIAHEFQAALIGQGASAWASDAAASSSYSSGQQSAVFYNGLSGGYEGIVDFCFVPLEARVGG